MMNGKIFFRARFSEVLKGMIRRDQNSVVVSGEQVMLTLICRREREGWERETAVWFGSDIVHNAGFYNEHTHTYTEYYHVF